VHGQAHALAGGGGVPAVAVDQQHRELVAADPGDDVPAAQQ
jgi:hypothetical protein